MAWTSSQKLFSAKVKTKENMKTQLMKAGLKGALGATLLLPVAASASLVSDGNFTAAGTPSTYTTFNKGQTMGGWSVVAGSVDLIGEYWQSPPGGGNSVDMAGNSSGTISQTISDLVVGQEYKLTFALSGNPDGQPGVKELGIGLTVGGGFPYAFSYTIGANSRLDMKYQLETEYFTATTTSEMLQFQDLSYLNYSGYNGSTPWGAVIGNVVLSAVPEPTTVVAGALLLLPFGMSTLRILRRKQTA